MSQHLNEDELAALLPEKNSVALQYTTSHDESDKNQSGDHSKKHVSFHAISYEVAQRRFFQKLMPKVILNNVRYTHVTWSVCACNARGVCHSSKLCIRNQL